MILYILQGHMLNTLPALQIHRLHVRAAKKKATRLAKEAEKKEQAAERLAVVHAYFSAQTDDWHFIPPTT